MEVVADVARAVSAVAITGIFCTNLSIRRQLNDLNVLKGSTRAPTEAVEVETAWEATTGLEEVEEDLDLAEVVAGGGPDLLEVRSTNKSL